jgi:membrane associated rhomboid family serine protease
LILGALGTIFFITTRRRYDETSWVFYVIGGASLITAFFGIVGAGAAIVAFLFFYFYGRVSNRREKRKTERKAEGLKKLKTAKRIKPRM